MPAGKSKRRSTGKAIFAGDQGSTRKRNFFVLLAVIALLALSLRLLVTFELFNANNGNNAVSSPPAATDMATYLRLGKLIAQGDFQDPFYLNNIHKYQPFYNSIFLPVVFWVFGCSVGAVLVIQSLIGALTVYLTGLAAAKLWSRQAAILAAVLTAFSQVLILYTPYMLVATLQAFWLVLLFYLALIALESGRKLHWALCALVASCAILSRGNAWFLVPGLMALAIYSLAVKPYKTVSRRRKTAYALLVGLLFLLLVILPQVPFAWRNTVLLGHFCGPSSDAPVVLSLGNTPESPPGGREAGLGAGPMEYPETYHLWTAKDSTMSVQRRIWNWFCEEPLAYIELTFRKLLLFWDYREIPNNVSLAGALRQSSWLAFGFLKTVFILVPALAGIFVLLCPSLRKKDLPILLLLYFILAYCAATVIFYILARFRAPLVPLLAVLAAGFANECWRLYKNKRRRLYIPYVLAICGSFFICVRAYDIYRFDCEAAVMRMIRPDGVKISLREGKTMYLDNGPRTFGGWQPVPLVAGMDIVKKFAVENIPDKATAQFELLLLFSAPGEAYFRIDGKLVRVVAGNPGMAALKYMLASPITGTVSCKMFSANRKVFIIVDKQRNYGRSSIDGEPLSGEIVSRLYVTK